MQRLATQNNNHPHIYQINEVSEAPYTLTERLSPLANKTALLIEDDPTVQYLHNRFLQQLNFVVDIANSQQEALDYAFRCRYDLIVTDLGLADNHEESIVIKLRSDASLNRKTPLLVATASDCQRIQSLCLRAGADAYIAKPMSKAQLESSLKRFFSNTKIPLNAHHSI